MASASDLLRRRLRRFLDPVKSTPLHPQWLVSRFGKGRTRWVAARAIGKVLDIGCADGSIRQALDLSTEYIGLDYPATASGLYGTRPTVYGTASRLPFGDGTFDAVLFLDVLEHVAEPELAMREARRVLVPGGCILLTIPFCYPLHDQPHDYQRFTREGLEFRLMQEGFGQIVVKEVGNGVDSAGGAMALALAQGCVEGMQARNWRVIFMPLVLILIPTINVLGWLLSCVLPAPRFMPGAYYVEAVRA